MQLEEWRLLLLPIDKAYLASTPDLQLKRLNWTNSQELLIFLIAKDSNVLSYSCQPRLY